MIADLKPYPETKESGLPWIGDIPSHWETRRLRHASDMRVSNVDKHTKSTETPVRLCNYVEVYKNERIRESTRFMEATASEDERVRFGIRKGDVLITKDSEQWNDIGVPALVEFEAPNLVCGYHLAILRPRPSLHGPFLHRALECHFIAAQFHVEANGVTRYGLSHGAIQGVAIPLPPLSEQAAIVRFLDWANGRLERAIRAKRKVIALLHEQKQAIIHKAVTQGLDPNVPKRDSGVPWLGEIPAHWEVVQLRQCTSFGPKNGTSPQAAESGGVLSLSISAVRDGVVTVEGNEKLVQFDRTLVGALRIQQGDILLVRGNGNVKLVGKCGLVRDCPDDCIYPDILMKIRTNDRMVSAFMVSAINDAYVSSQVVTLAKTANGAFKVSGATVRSLLLVVPPYPEQEQVVASITHGTNKLTTAIDRYEREITLLREYRTRLVADVVTGKLDVREAALLLPEEDVVLSPEDVGDEGEEPELEEVEG